MCPHQDIPLVEGKFDGKLLVCRAHQWMFDASTGQGVNPSNCQLAEYPLKIDGDDVMVDTDGVETPVRRHMNTMSEHRQPTTEECDE